MKAWVLPHVCLIGAVLCSAVEEWTAGIFPNPQEDPERCGGTRKSFLCDPDHLLSQDNAGILDVLTMDVFRETEAPCAYQGYRIAIALVTAIKDTGRPINTSLSDNAIQARQMLNKLSRSRTFANDVRKAWQLDECGEDVLIIFSKREDVVYTACGSAAKKKLGDDVVYEISERAHPLFRDGDIFNGLKKMVKDYRSVFDGSYVPVPMVTFSPLVGFIVGPADGANTLHAAVTTSLTVAIVTAALIT